MQNLIVAVIVACACWHVLRRYLPVSLRHSVLDALAALCGLCGWKKMAARLRSAAQAGKAAPPASGCDSCSACAKGVNNPVQRITADSLKRTIRRN